MALSAADLLGLLDRVRAAAAGPGRPGDRAAALAATLRYAWPTAAVTACRLDDPAGTAVAALDHTGRPKPEIAAAIGNGLGAAVGEVNVAGLRVRVAPLQAGDRRHGGLAAAVPAEEAPTLAAVARAAAEVLDRAALAAELADRESLADLGEVVGPVTHEFNNFLNTLMLQVAVMEMTVPETVRAELQGVKRQGKQVAAMVKQLQQYRRRRCGADAQPADLNRGAADAAAAAERAPADPNGGPRVRPAADADEGDVGLRLDLAADLPLVPGPAADLRRLCRFLLTGAAWAVAGGGSLILATRPAGAGAALRMEAAGAATGALARMLEGPVGLEGGHGLELAACQSLVRRLGGSLRAEPLPGGEAIVVELPAAGA
jgi:signal transduction histidine kinase